MHHSKAALSTDLKQIMHRTLCNSKSWLQRERSSHVPAVRCFI